MFFVLILINILFIYFFYYINFIYGIYLISIILIFLFSLSLFSKTGQNGIKLFIKFCLVEYSMYINFFIILSGFYLILNYFFQQSYGVGLMSDLKSLFFVLLMSIIINFASCFAKKQDLLKVSYFGFFVIWLYMFYLLGNIDVLEFFISFLLSISVVSHLIYFTKHNKYNYFILYMIFLSSVISFLLLIKNVLNLEPNMLSLIVQFLVFCLLFYALYTKNIYEGKIQLEQEVKKREYEMGVFGYSEIQISDEQEKEYNTFMEKRMYYESIMDFFVNSPTPVKVIFALTNSIPVFFATRFFFQNLQTGNSIYNEIIYRLGGVLFFINFILFKKLNWFVMVQRIFAFFVINFVTYFTIIDFMGNDYFYIALGGIVWNLLTTSMIIFLGHKGGLLGAVDYATWSFINFLGVALNVYFLLKIGLNIYFISGVILLYIGLYIALYRIIYKKYFNL